MYAIGNPCEFPGRRPAAVFVTWRIIFSPLLFSGLLASLDCEGCHGNDAMRSASRLSVCLQLNRTATRGTEGQRRPSIFSRFPVELQRCVVYLANTSYLHTFTQSIIFGVHDFVGSGGACIHLAG